MAEALPDGRGAAGVAQRAWRLPGCRAAGPPGDVAGDIRYRGRKDRWPTTGLARLDAYSILSWLRCR
jgi:hypothetical protein